MLPILREYLLRGGFLMVDDFHGSDEWAVFEAGMRQIFPDRPIVDIDDKDGIFHVIYDLDDRYQVPGAQYLRSGRTYEGYDGSPARWRGIYDDKNRLMVAIVFNSDLGDSWEWADVPQYDEKFSALGIRIAFEAGYDPRAMAGVMEVLAQASGGSRQPEFASTHPAPENRQARIKEEIAKRFPSGVPDGLTK